MTTSKPRTFGDTATCDCGKAVEFIGQRTWVDQQGQTHCPPVNGAARYHRPARVSVGT